MTKNILTTDNPVSVRGLIIIPVVKLSLHYSFAAGVSVFSTKQPIAVVLVAQSQKKALRITGEEVPLKQLMLEVPDLKETLERITPVL